MALVKEPAEEISKVLDEPRVWDSTRSFEISKRLLNLKKDMHLTKGLSTVKFAVGNYLKDRVLKNDSAIFTNHLFQMTDNCLGALEVRFI